MTLALTKKGRFKSSEELTPAPEGYSLLPFRFERSRSKDQEVILVNECGEYMLLNDHDLEDFVNHRLSPNSSAYTRLRRSGFLVDSESTSSARLSALKLRTRYKYLPEFTGLHMFVVTLRCNQSCPYCQVSRQSEDRAAFDMSVSTAEKALRHVFKSPNINIKIEFQGGESLLNFDLIKFIFARANELNIELPQPKNLQFVAATNLTFLTKEIIDFFGANDILFSTSIDGPEDIHNSNRPYKGANAFNTVCENIRLIQRTLGHDKVSALMTTTARSIGRVEQIVDQYVALGFEGIFLRPLSPYGFAIKTKTYYDYSAEEWFQFYAEGLEYILRLNKNGLRFTEYYTSLLLQKMTSHNNTGYVNLQSPAGSGIMGVIYDYNGKIYASDEGRMMAQMQDDSFCIGSVDDTFEEVFLGERLFGMLDESISQSSPQCSDCAFLPWCGSDPEYHWSTQRDAVGHKAFSGFCKKNMAIFHHLIERLERNDEYSKILRSWV